jgi:hypothetical protein
MVSKIEVHTSSVTLLVVQISKFVFNCRKLCETCVLFVNIYNLTLSKPYEHLMLWYTYGFSQVWDSYDFENVNHHSNLKVCVELLETMSEMYPFVSSVCRHFLETIYFWWQGSGPKHVVMPICRIFWPNLDIIVFIMLYFQDKSLNVSHNSYWISHQSLKYGIEWNIEFSKWFLWFFPVLLEVHIGQLGNTFENYAEIHINDVK